MKPRRCGKLYGFTGSLLIQGWLVRFHRKSRWTSWAIWSISACPLAGPDVRRLEPRVKELMMRKIADSQVRSAKRHLDDTDGLKALPQLLTFLTDPVLEAESGNIDRLPGSIYIVPRDGILSVTLKEPSQALMLRLDVPKFHSLWQSIELALSDVSSIWESDPWAKQRKPRARR